MHPLFVPIRHDVDLCIIGGTTSAVATALAVARRGASVVVLTDRPYMGEDLAGTLRGPGRRPIVSDLGRALFDPARTAPPSPRHLKYTLETALLEAGVPFLFGCHPAMLLRDREEAVAGLLMACRGGFFGVRARQVVDATWSGQVARMAGLPFSSRPSASKRVEAVVISRTPRMDADWEAEGAPYTVEWGHQGRERETITACRYRYRFDLPLVDASHDARMQVELTARERSWNPEILYRADSVWWLPPDHLQGAGNRGGEAVGDFSPERFQTELPGLALLGPCAVAAVDEAEALTELENFLEAGERLGTHLATAMPEGPSAEPAGWSHAAAGPLSVGEIVATNDAVRTGADTTWLTLPMEAVPQWNAVDVLVMGGGTAGASAGIAAARQGVKTLVAEYQPMLGGVGTAGQITGYWFGNKTGFTAAMDAEIAAMGDPVFQLKTYWNPEWKAHWYERTLLGAGGRLWYGATGCGVHREGKRVRGVLVATPNGFGLVPCGMLIDATGNADLAAHAGAACEWIQSAHVAVQGTGQGPREPGKYYNNTDWTFSDDCDLEDATQVHLLSRHKFADAFDTQGCVNTRERRRIVGEMTLSPVDILAARTFPDTIVTARSNFDSHGFTIHPLFMVKPPDKLPLTAHVPLRALLPKGWRGLLVTGLGKSAHRDALPVIRMQADVQNEGYAAGLAAAMVCGSETGDVRSLDTRELQRELVTIGNLAPEVVGQEDSFPLPEAVVREAVREGLDMLRGIAVVLAHPTVAVSLLRERWQSLSAAPEMDEEVRTRMAVLLGLLGDATGAGYLSQRLDAPWDAGWNFRGMGQFGASMSPQDVALLALVESADAGAKPVVLRKLAALTPADAMSHSRAVAMAVEGLRLREAAPLLARLLGSEGVRGHAWNDLARIRETLSAGGVENADRNLSLRELHLARALYRVGDWQGAGEAVLREYAVDLRGIYARHAGAVLREGPWCMGGGPE